MKKIIIMAAVIALTGSSQIVMAQPPGGPGENGPPTFESMDTDKNGTLNREEVVSVLEVRFASGGEITGTGLGPPPGGFGPGGKGFNPEAVFDLMDADNSGEVTESEFYYSQRSFDGSDLDDLIVKGIVQDIEKRSGIIVKAENIQLDRVYRTYDEEEAEAYRALIINVVAQNWNIPAGVQNGLKVDIEVRLLYSGEIVSAYIAESSGDADFDKSAEQAIAKIESFPEVQKMDPVLYGSQFMRFTLSFRPEELLILDKLLR